MQIQALDTRALECTYKLLYIACTRAI
jgi:hypothetical protein